MASSELVIPDPAEIEEKIKLELGDTIERITKLARNIIDDDSRAVAVDAGVELKGHLVRLKLGREEDYLPLYRGAENIRMKYDPKIKLANELLKTLSSGVSGFDIKKRREEQIAREAKEKEAREAQEEADRLKREADEAAARVKAEAEARKQAEEDRKKAEAEAKREAEVDAREAARKKREDEEAERRQQAKEEEDARLAHAKEAEAQGNDSKVDTILEQKTPVAAPVGEPTGDTKAEAEAKRIAEEDAAKAKAEADAREAEARERERIEKEKADAAKEDARLAAQAAAGAQEKVEESKIIAVRPDDRTRSTTRWTYVVTDPIALFRAIAEGRAPVEYSGFDPLKPSKFRPSAIGKDVTKLKGEFKCDGVETRPEATTSFKAGA